MPSKLFHAVVGVGISLGSVAACGGATSEDAALLSPDATELPADGGLDVAIPLPEAAPPDAAQGDAAVDAPPDAAPVLDATPVPSDAIVEAFCDVTWPITKAGREACGPIDDCAGLQIPWCLEPDGQGSCKLYPLECVGAEWQCLGGVTPTLEPGSQCP